MQYKSSSDEDEEEILEERIFLGKIIPDNNLTQLAKEGDGKFDAEFVKKDEFFNDLVIGKCLLVKIFTTKTTK